ncbi:S-layer homology domain-containing protein [Paenibacillus roseipurpureus]|uniref:S-layer homology domain-containing protein n=1 Tax=Paenibacillus roseopurpureus TaxID=2918901 RepID=A0AA96RN22_9BACL|nr:YcdB/YcdC domain-containing protein [Paenibacillus sp. MBLB1832]WNR47046.1 S-layer homology domain-containing protein [Paenibacillus sp. MBLB1832]
MKRTLRTVGMSMCITVIGVSVLSSQALAADIGIATSTKAAASTNAPNTNANPVDAKISKDEAVERIRKLFPLLQDADTQSVNFGDPYTYPPSKDKVWTIQWQLKTENGGFGFSSKVDAMNGDILQMYVPTLNDPRSNISHFPPKVTREQAKQLAKDYVIQLAPSITSDALQINDDFTPYQGLTSLFAPVQYAFNFNIMIHGVKLNDGGIQITLDGEGNVLNFHKNPQLDSYPSTDPKITLEQATQFAKEHQAVDLQYIPIRKGNKIESWWLGYVPLLPPIDGQTGQFVTLGMPRNALGSNYVPISKRDKVFTPLTKTGEITVEEAAQIVENAFPQLKEKKLQQKSLNDGWNGDNHKVWTLSWGNNEPMMGPIGSNSATLDAQTGIILNYSTNTFGPYPPAAATASTEPAISKDAAQQRAEEVINLVYPNASEDLKRIDPAISLVVSTNPPQQYSYTFQRFYKGLAVSGDTVNLILDLSGNVMNYFAHISTLDDQVMSKLKQNVSKEQALEKIWESEKLELNLNSFGGYVSNTTYEQPVAKLVYNQVLKSGSLNAEALDATDGTWKPVWFEKTSQPSVNPSDIAGHWAQQDLETMLQYQVLTTDDSGHVNPDQTITVGDWLTMMSSAWSPQYKNFYNGNRNDKPYFADINESSPYYDAVRTFIQLKWLTAESTRNFNADQALTREALASSVIHILKYNKLSSLLAPTVTELPFTDSNLITNKSDVALALELGIMEGSDGAFEPLATVTKAQAAVVLMRLVHLQGKLDQNIGQ